MTKKECTWMLFPSLTLFFIVVVISNHYDICSASNLSDKVVKINKDFTFTCGYTNIIPVHDNDTDPLLMLQRDGVTVLSVIIHRNRTVSKILFGPRFQLSGNDKSLDFVLKSVKTTDQGVYTCIANLTGGSTRRGLSINLKVVDLPKIVLKPPDESYSLFHGDSLIIQCLVTNFQTNLLQSWVMNDSIVKQGIGLSITVTKDLELYCNATNDIGTTKSKLVAVNVKAIEPSKPKNLRITSRKQESSFSQQILLKWDKSDYTGRSAINKYKVMFDGKTYKNVTGSTEITFTNLNIYHQHKLEVAACNQDGCSQFATFFVDSAPSLNLTVSGITSDSLILGFVRQVDFLNNITSMRICIDNRGQCTRKEMCKDVDPTGKEEIKFSNLESYCIYQCLGHYVTVFDESRLNLMTSVLNVRTKESVPSKVSDIYVQYDDVNYQILQIYWRRPRFINADRVTYSVSCVPRGASDQYIDARITSVLTDPLDNYHEYIFWNLKAFTIYSIKIKAINNAGLESIAEILKRTDEKMPSAPMNLSKVSLTATSLKVKWIAPQLLPPITEYKIKYTVSDKFVGLETTSEREFEFRGLKPGKNYSVQVKAVVVQKRTGQRLEGPSTKQWYLTSVEPMAAESDDRETLIIVTCVMLVLIIFALIIAMYYCQRKSFGFNNRATFYFDNNDQRNSMPTEIRRSIRKAELKSQPMTLKEFEEHCNDLHANTDYLFSEEYASLGPRHPDKSEVTYENSKTEVNRAKNRYPDIFANDQSRVRLMSLEGVVGSNYINANYVDGYKHPNAYIATQAPLTHTVGDFWRMIWERKSHIIIMLTNLVERGRKKCDQYWPNNGTEIYKNYHVTLETTSQLANYTIRKLRVSRQPKEKPRDEKADAGDDTREAVEEREIWQYHFEEWPDFGTPHDRGSVISFIMHCREHEKQYPGPPVVHCSAGVGRTGTYIMMDSLMRRYNDTKEVEVYYYLKMLRKQRNYLVQSESQYIFVHDALLDYMKSGDTMIPVDEIDNTINCKDFFDKIDEEWQHLEKYTIPLHMQIVSQRPYNLHRNRSQAVVSADSYRVRLMMKAGVEGSDYINATFLDSFQCKQAFIITQHPLESTKEDFWRMIWEHNSLVIINFTHTNEMDNEANSHYVPEEIEETFGRFFVKIEEERIENNYVCKTLLLRNEDVREDQYNTNERQIYHYHFHEWMPDCFPRNAFLFKLLLDVSQSHKKVRNRYPKRRSFISTRDLEPPITIHCSTGSSRSGLFSSLMIFKEHLENDFQKVDVYGTIRSMMLRRSSLIQSKTEYEYLHKALLALKLYMGQEAKERSFTLTI